MISIVIPYRYTDDYHRFLPYIIDQFHGETIVVEEDSKPHEMDCGADKYLFIKSDLPFNKSRCLNVGIREAENNAVILHDCDIIVPPIYEQTIKEYLDKVDAVHLGGPLIYLDEQQTSAILTGIASPYGFAVSPDKYIFDYPWGSMAVKKDRYIEIGGMNEAFKGHGGEDVSFNEILIGYNRILYLRLRYMVFMHLHHKRTPGHKNMDERRREWSLSIEKRIEENKRNWVARYGDNQ